MDPLIKHLKLPGRGLTIIYEANGKEQCIKESFSDIDADVYLVVDGDDTYDPCFPRMVKMLVEDKLDMVVAVSSLIRKSLQNGHQFETKRLINYSNCLQAIVFDIFSGYRVFQSLRKIFSALSYDLRLKLKYASTPQLRLTKEIVALSSRPIGSNAS